VQGAFVAVLIFSVRWQNRKPEAVTAELYAPPSKTQATAAPPQPRLRLRLRHADSAART
jgi:hypothetical protein